MHTDEVCGIIYYYSLTCFGHFSTIIWMPLKEYRQNITAQIA
jgi:hypothetical protein